MLRTWNPSPYLLALLVVACGGGSTEPVVPEGSGRLELPLIAQGPDGGPYQLVNATFIITGPQNLTITDTSSDEVIVPLTAGVYSIRLDGNWHLERLEEPGQPVPAELVSPNPMTFAVASDESRKVRFVFKTPGRGDVDLGFTLDTGHSSDRGLEHFALPAEAKFSGAPCPLGVRSRGV